ncbi:unnamed protein product, partial [Pylaiella littoralis]
MAAVAASSAEIIGGTRSIVRKATEITSQWDRKKHIAFSHVAHLGVDSVLFALRLRASSVDAAAASKSVTAASARGQEDPATRGRRNRDRERATRDAKRKEVAAAAVAAAKARPENTTHDNAGVSHSSLRKEMGRAYPCQNKSCVRRGSTEEKLMAKWEKVKTELGGKVKGVQKLRRSVGETERQRDAAIKEITALEEAGEMEVAGAGELKKRLHAAESEGRRILEESQRWEVELRKLRVQYQEETQRRLPMPHGSIISEASAWAAAAAAPAETLPDDEEEPPPPPPPFVSDGLAVRFFPRGRGQQRYNNRTNCYGNNGPHAAGGAESGQETKTRPSREHSGRFERWGPEAREQWSCCLWEEGNELRTEGGGGIDSNGGNGGGIDSSSADINDPAVYRGGGKSGRGWQRGRGVAGGCETVPLRPGPGGMTTADDVRLVWGGSRVRQEAWGAGGDGGGSGGGGGSGDDRELWRPMLATKMSGGGGGGGGAAWSLIRHRRRPQTANARMVGRRTATTTAEVTAGATTTPTASGRTNDDIAPFSKEQNKTAAGAGLRGCGGGGNSRPRGVGHGNNSGSSSNSTGIRRSGLCGSTRPGSAPPSVANSNCHRHNRYHYHNNNKTVKKTSSLMSLRSARARAGWQRKRPPPPAGGGNNSSGVRAGDPFSDSNSHSNNRVLRGGVAEGGGKRASWAARQLQSRSLMSLSAGGSTYTVYSKGEERGAGKAAA